MNVSYTVKWNTKALNLLNTTPKKIMFATARNFLDIVSPKIPRDTGRMRQETLRYGVKSISGGYRICSNVRYAIYPYNMDNNKTNWTTPNTESEWFDREWKTKGTSISISAIKRNEIK